MLTLITAIPATLPTSHQDLMDLFYNEWQAQSAHMKTLPADQMRGIGQEEIAQLMPAKVNIATMLGNWNYQVHNGGYMQWHDNSYSGAGETIRDYLDRGRSVGVEGLEPMIESLDKALKEIGDLSSSGYDYDEDDDFGCNDRWDEAANQLLWDTDSEVLMQNALDAFDQVESTRNYSTAFRKAA